MSKTCRALSLEAWSSPTPALGHGYLGQVGSELEPIMVAVFICCCFFLYLVDLRPADLCLCFVAVGKEWHEAGTHVMEYHITVLHFLA